MSASARPSNRPRVVITHDFAEVYGGAERVTEVLAEEFPDAPVWTIAGRQEIAERMGIADRWHSILPENETLLKRFRLLTPLYPALLAARRLPDADVVLSSSYAFAHYFRTKNDAPQVCYCHSPLRFAWSMTDAYQSIWSSSSAGDVGFRAVASAMRWTDKRAASRVQRYLTQSPYTANQIERFYGVTPDVIGAPIDCTLFKPSTAPREDFFLIVSRLIEPYKRVGVAVEAFRKLGLPLVVAGGGPALEELKRIAPPNVTFLGQQDDASVVDLMQRCRALLFPSQDDFGLVPVEAMSCGTPIIAFRGGGATHTVVEGFTGTFFDEQTPESVEAAIRTFDPEQLDTTAIRMHAQQWDVPAFRARVRAAVEEVAGCRDSAAAAPPPLRGGNLSRTGGLAPVVPIRPPGDDTGTASSSGTSAA
ncbi:MAG: glycosyltransferase [Solirubrobacteraceae bacterium]|nr:glycosyltransferase [Solirubrobacteraceae bacterium]